MNDGGRIRRLAVFQSRLEPDLFSGANRRIVETVAESADDFQNSNSTCRFKYDFEKKRVVANREIANRNMPIMSFGEDENGELYLMTFSASGQGIDRIVRK